MHKLIEYICDELEDLEMKVDRGGRLSMQEVEYMDTLAHTKKNLLKAEEMSDEYRMGGMSMRGGSYARGGGYRGSNQYGSYRTGGGRSYEMDGRSYARRRDSRGRYSRDESETLVSELRQLMEQAPDEVARREFQKFISKMEDMQ